MAHGEHESSRESKTMSVLERVAAQQKKEEETRIKKIKNALDALKDQFKNPETYIKELVQNAIDAESTRIDVSFFYDTQKKQGSITVNDNGIGMNEETIRKYLLTLFQSKKESDITKIGRFGVGFVSVFRQDNLEQIVVNTCDGKDAYRVVLLPPDKGWQGKIYKKADQAGTQKGTSVVLDVKTEEAQFNTIEKKITEEINQSCAYVTTSLFVNGTQVNKEFSIPNAKYQLRFGGGTDIEGVIGYTPDDIGFTAYFNRRLLVSKEDHSLFEHRGILLTDFASSESSDRHLSVMISSSYIDYNISRDSILQNKRYKQIVNLINKKKDQFVMELVKDLSTKPQYGLTSRVHSTIHIGREPRPEVRFTSLEFTGDSVLYEFIINFAKETLATKEEEVHENKIINMANDFGKFIRRNAKKALRKWNIKDRLDNFPKEFYMTPFISAFKDVGGKPALVQVSIDDVLEQGMKEKSILATTTISGEMGAIECQLLSKGKIILPRVQSSWFGESKKSEEDPQRRLLEHFMPYAETTWKYQESKFEDDSTLPPKAKEFISSLRDLIRESPLNKRISDVFFGTERGSDKNAYYFRSPQEQTYGTYGKKKLLGPSRAWKERVRDNVYNRRVLMLDRSHPFIQEGLQLYIRGIEPHLLATAILTAASYDMRQYDEKMPLKISSYLSEKFPFPLQEIAAGSASVSPASANFIPSDKTYHRLLKQKIQLPPDLEYD